MAWLRRRPSAADLPPAITAACGLARGERVLAFGVDDTTGGYVVATTYALAVVTPGAESSEGVSASAERVLRRPWLFVDAGAWEPEAGTLSVTWTDGARGVQWSFRDQATLLPEALRERVQASVVIGTRLVLGDRRSGRVAIRQDFETRDLVPQTILGRYTRADDPEVKAHVDAALAHLSDQVGLRS